MYYRYCPATSALNLLRQLRLYFTPPECFNDINEMCPIISTEIPRNDYLRYFYTDKYLKPAYKYLLDAGLFSGAYSVFVERAGVDEDIISIVHRCIQNACAGLERSFRATMNRHVGVSCMTEVPTSNLMWGHYASSHTGVCLGYSFDYSTIVLIDNKPADYRDTKVSLPAWILDLPDKERFAYYSKVAFSKAREWSYEKEHRLLANLTDCYTENRNGATYYYQRLDKRDIRKLILGIRCQHESEFRDVISQQKMNLPVHRCEQKGSSFALSISIT